MGIPILGRLGKKKPVPKEESPEEKAKRLKDELKEAERQAKEKKKLDDLARQARERVPAPPAVPIPGAQPANVQSLEEFPIGQKIGWEVTRLVEGQTKRITIVRGQVAIKADRFGRPPKAMFVKVSRAGRNSLYFIDPQRLIRVKTLQRGKEVESYKVVFHEFICEPMKADGTIEWSDELEMILADSGLDQYVQIAASDLGFQLTPTIRNVMIIVAFLGLLMGLALNGAFHLTPTTIVHWVP
jgi:hypothetical protein